MNRIYLDYNSTTPVDERVLNAMLPYFSKEFGNPSSVHSYGSNAKAALDKAREQVAEFLGASPNEIVFTSGGTEANNLAIFGTTNERDPKSPKHIITTKTEHESVLMPVMQLEKTGYEVTYLGVDSGGTPNIEELKENIRESTVLISTMYANNETGTITPLKEIAGIANNHGITFHSDSVQASGKIAININDLGVDTLSISSHKFYGPKGTGALYIRGGPLKNRSFAPTLYGGGQERGMRSGTENVGAIVGFGKACEIAGSESPEDSARIKLLRDELLQSIRENIEGVSVNGDPDNSLPNTLNIGIEGVSGDSIVMNLDLDGIAISTGSACSEGNIEPSHVLRAMGLSSKEASSSIRISLGKYTTNEDTKALLQSLSTVVNRIRNV